MYLASSDRRADFADRIGGSAVKAHWLIDSERGGATLGKVGVIEIGPGGSASVAPEPGNEEMLFVLDGHGTVRTGEGPAGIRTGSVIFLPPETSVGLQAGNEILRLLLIHGGPGDVAQAGKTSPAATPTAAAKITHLDDLENHPVHKPELGFWHVAARWLVTAEAANSTSFMVGQSTFVKDAAHLLHMHDRGDEFFCVFDGEGSHLVEGDEWPMKPGDVVYAPRNEWHGFRNRGERPVRAIFGYFGPASLDRTGYVLHPQSR